jgi:non-heme chloroperoxidase
MRAFAIIADACQYRFSEIPTVRRYLSMSRLTPDRSPVSRRGAILAGAAISAPLVLSSASSAATSSDVPAAKGASSGKTITAKDGARIFYKDWGKGQPIVFSHGWPLSSDAWDNQMLFFGQHGYRVVAHDRRSHGRSDQTWDGNNMDKFADDLAELIIRDTGQPRRHAARSIRRDPQRRSWRPLAVL